jgi:hypothetical protein
LNADQDYQIHKAMAFLFVIYSAMEGAPERLMDLYGPFHHDWETCHLALTSLHLRSKDKAFYDCCRLCLHSNTELTCRIPLYFPSARERIEALSWFREFTKKQSFSQEVSDALSRVLRIYTEIRQDLP